jgi:hypothetical protein
MRDLRVCMTVICVGWLCCFSAATLEGSNKSEARARDVRLQADALPCSILSKATAFDVLGGHYVVSRLSRQPLPRGCSRQIHTGSLRLSMLPLERGWHLISLRSAREEVWGVSLAALCGGGPPAASRAGTGDPGRRQS